MKVLFKSSSFRRYTRCECGYIELPELTKDYALQQLIHVCPECGMDSKSWTMPTLRWVSKSKIYNPLTWGTGGWEESIAKVPEHQPLADDTKAITDVLLNFVEKMKKEKKAQSTAPTGEVKDMPTGTKVINTEGTGLTIDEILRKDFNVGTEPPATPPTT